MERAPLLVLLVLATVGSCGVWAQTRREMADSAWQSYAQCFLTAVSPGQQYLLDTYPDPSHTLTHYWTFAEGVNAMASYAQLVLPNGGGGRGGSAAEWNTRFTQLFAAQADPLVGGGFIDDYFDDESWMGCALDAASQLFANFTAYAQTAVDVILPDLQAHAWDTTCCAPLPLGGNWWDRAHTQKATASNAGAAVLAAKLYGWTRDPNALAYAREVYAHWRYVMVNETTGQVADHITSTGERVAWVFTYNQSLMFSAAALLARIAYSDALIADALLYVAFLQRTLTRADGDGRVVLADACAAAPTDCSGDCPQFKGAAVRHLSELYDALGVVPSSSPLYAQAVAARAGVQRLLTDSADAVWANARDADTGLFGCDWTAPYSVSVNGTAYQTQQNAALTLLSTVARLFPDA